MFNDIRREAPYVFSKLIFILLHKLSEFVLALRLQFINLIISFCTRSALLKLIASDYKVLYKGLRMSMYSL